MLATPLSSPLQNKPHIFMHIKTNLLRYPYLLTKLSKECSDRWDDSIKIMCTKMLGHLVMEKDKHNLTSSLENWILEEFSMFHYHLQAKIMQKTMWHPYTWQISHCSAVTLSNAIQKWNSSRIVSPQCNRNRWQNPHPSTTQVQSICCTYVEIMHWCCGCS